MAERLRDKEDAMLEALFRAGPHTELIEDDGFSDRVVSRIRRGIWIRRWTLPIAILIGGLIAAKPAAQILLAMAEILTATPMIPEDIRTLSVDALPQATMFVFGGTLVGIIALFIKGLEE
ncbi:MAG: hypothetical protein ACREQ1_04050 [Woeseiaceae bacterium]